MEKINKSEWRELRINNVDREYMKAMNRLYSLVWYYGREDRREENKLEGGEIKNGKS